MSTAAVLACCLLVTAGVSASQHPTSYQVAVWLFGVFELDAVRRVVVVYSALVHVLIGGNCTHDGPRRTAAQEV
jgi:hypothetical protein